MLRIIAGELGGRRLRAPAGMRTRPTADRVRESLFNILALGPDFASENATVLDLYAGSGALGIEALSRGAARAIFVEQDGVACRTLSQNLRDMQRETRAQVIARPVQKALPMLLAEGPFRLIFADPPYKSDELPWLLGQIARNRALSPHGFLILERATRDADALAAAPAEGLSLVDRRRYGDTSLLFYRPVGESS